jgi:hypothetical protein
MMSITLQDYFWASERAVTAAFVGSTPRDFDKESAIARGFYSELAGHCVGLFVVQRQLFVLIDGEAMEVKGRHTSATFQQTGGSSSLRIHCGGRDWRINYVNTGVALSSLTYTAEEEDANFGLWMANVINSDERRQVFIENWPNT